MERERAGWRQPGDSAVGAAGREEQGRVLHSLHASLCSFAVWFHVHLNQTASDASADLSFRGSVFQLVSNSDSSPKVYFKISEFIFFLSEGALQRHHF